MTEKPKRSRNRAPANTTSRLSDEQLRVMGELFGTGFVEWYKATHDENGRVLPSARVPGLRPPGEDEQP